MAKTKPTRTPKTPAAAVPAPPPATTTDVLLDWRFNLIVIGCMEMLLIIFALPREIERYQYLEAQKALWRQDYLQAYRRYYALNRDDPSNTFYLQRLGDATLGRGQYPTALEYYRKATSGAFNTPEIRIQVAKIFDALANTEKDPKQRREYAETSAKFREMARDEAPNDLKINYELGQLALKYGSLIEAAEFLSHVRADAIPGGAKPNEEQQRMINEAKKYLAQIQSIVFNNADYRLDLTGVEIRSTPTLTAPAVRTTTGIVPLVSSPAPAEITSPALARPPVPTTAPAATRPPVATPKPTPVRAPGTTTTAGVRPPVVTPKRTIPPALARPTPPPSMRIELIPTTGPEVDVSPRP
jgi:hypothetical protein